MVIMSPAIPSETAKAAPIPVRRPIGRISVVTIAKMPSVTAATAGQPRAAGPGRGPAPPDGCAGEVVGAAMESAL
ncbi:hypothetical protein GCM10010400_14710 [Streptomyces aculeolatus]